MASMHPDHEASPAGNKKLLLVITERDIVFNCAACQGELVVDMAGAGMEVPCSHCGKVLKVPDYQPQPSARPSGVTLLANDAQASAPPPDRHFDFGGYSAEQLEHRRGELTGQLKENRSQDTEMRGHVGRATMELHRLQLRMKKLQERRTDIEAELAALNGRVSGPDA